MSKQVVDVVHTGQVVRAAMDHADLAERLFRPVRLVHEVQDRQDRVVAFAVRPHLAAEAVDHVVDEPATVENGS